jgi:hypothetical protein
MRRLSAHHVDPAIDRSLSKDDAVRGILSSASPSHPLGRRPGDGLSRNSRAVTTAMESRKPGQNNGKRGKDAPRRGT